ncbi:TetR/AcrR family transcriptional regulator [Pseudogracilibacillus auburnensis]|uniref:TetR family transcriptional regulator n=1 Tax=Pseudogracilibacillus auburnensis TaxID=1494959 RepID=A0A2V3VSJ2_9BACI|nr:TetR/AcrR family transcriptional regulator [Pseudogracilibacillus auburnensis]MBO1003914.1 TetR/AcrR family transcriptional regulator [Pseudogracilibacillus auburnensis]PXW84843.1 TetR family transcriptional regulator [Pseudogracilibacillus auburnensis]
MAKGPKGFTEAEKDNLRTKLCIACERSWALHGYKKTSIGELTAKIGISTGAFYMLYSSKEDLFCDSLERVQSRLKNRLRDIICQDGGKEGFTKAMKWHFEEYDRYPFLYDCGTPDFLSFLNKLPKERVEKLKFDSAAFFDETMELANLTLKVQKEKAHALIGTLLYTVTIKDKLDYDHFEVFDFLLDSVVDKLFE